MSIKKNYISKGGNVILEEVKRKINSSEYDFLKTNEHLRENIILLGLGGSYAYGTNIPDSDLDIRGIALNTKREILVNKKFEQVLDEKTDTVIYSFNKIISLLSNCNPNTIEILGFNPDEYLYLSPIGKELVDNKDLFLSKKAVQSFSGYATSQLRRLDNKAARTVNQAQREQHILNSINNAFVTFPNKYFEFPQDAIKLYIDKSVQEDFNTEIFMDINLLHYPLRDWKSMWSEMNNIVKDYSKIGKRNKHAVEHGKLAKHMTHLIRLYLMCLDILEKGEIITRRPEHEFLMSIRNGKYLDKNDHPVPEFYEIVDELERKVKYAAKNTFLPDKPDYKKIDEFVASVNERVVRGKLNSGQMAA